MFKDESTSDLVQEVRNCLAGVETINIFATSFSEHGDLLSQWRAYTTDYGGYSIGFSYEKLQAALKKQGFKIAPCVYSKRKQERLIDELLKKTRQFNQEHGRSGWGGMGSSATEPNMNEFVFIASLMKHPSFAQEGEWRIISEVRDYNEQAVDFREDKSTLVPYFKFKLSESATTFPLSRIIIGPTPHRELARLAIWGLLFNLGILPRSEKKGKSLNDWVCLTETSYRAW